MIPAERSLNQVLHQWTEVFMRRSFRDFKRFIDDAGLSPAQAAALMRLYHCEACGVSELAGHVGFTRPAASQMIERLVQQGLLTRAEDPRDRRGKQVTLTPKGRALVEAGIAARRQWLEQITRSLSPAEQETIAGALTLLAEAAQKLETE